MNTLSILKPILHDFMKELSKSAYMQPTQIIPIALEDTTRLLKPFLESPEMVVECQPYWFPFFLKIKEERLAYYSNNVLPPEIHNFLSLLDTPNWQPSMTPELLQNILMQCHGSFINVQQGLNWIEKLVDAQPLSLLNQLDWDAIAIVFIQYGKNKNVGIFLNKHTSTHYDIHYLIQHGLLSEQAFNLFYTQRLSPSESLQILQEYPKAYLKNIVSCTQFPDHPTLSDWIIQLLKALPNPQRLEEMQNAPFFNIGSKKEASLHKIPGFLSAFQTLLLDPQRTWTMPSAWISYFRFTTSHCLDHSFFDQWEHHHPEEVAVWLTRRIDNGRTEDSATQYFLWLLSHPECIFDPIHKNALKKIDTQTKSIADIFKQNPGKFSNLDPLSDGYNPELYPILKKWWAAVELIAAKDSQLIPYFLNTFKPFVQQEKIDTLYDFFDPSICTTPLHDIWNNFQISYIDLLNSTDPKQHSNASLHVLTSRESVRSHTDALIEMTPLVDINNIHQHCLQFIVNHPQTTPEVRNCLLNVQKLLLTQTVPSGLLKITSRRL